MDPNHPAFPRDSASFALILGTYPNFHAGGQP
jgi:hypothetical protein